MSEGSEIGGIYRGAYKAAIELVCTSVDAYAKVAGQSQAIADVMLFEIAKHIEMMPEGRAAKFLDHFLFGGGEDMTFYSATLLNEDIGVRRRVSDVIGEKLRANPSLAKKNMSGGEYVISIRQRDYLIPDWKNALGSFAFEWELANLSSDRKRIFANVWGANEYKWHPAADRVTQCIHKAGDRLAKSKEVRARNFWMIGKPTIIVISTGKPIDV